MLGVDQIPVKSCEDLELRVGFLVQVVLEILPTHVEGEPVWGNEACLSRESSSGEVPDALLL